MAALVNVMVSPLSRVRTPSAGRVSVEQPEESDRVARTAVASHSCRTESMVWCSQPPGDNNKQSEKKKSIARHSP
jgi:hypothetical protein